MSIFQKIFLLMTAFLYSEEMICSKNLIKKYKLTIPQEKLFMVLYVNIQAHTANSTPIIKQNHNTINAFDAIENKDEDEDHRLILRIPKSLMAKIDIKRKQRIGKISRNLWILETLERATRK